MIHEKKPEKKMAREVRGNSGNGHILEAKARENYGREWPVVSNIKVKSAKTGKDPLNLSGRW